MVYQIREHIRQIRQARHRPAGHTSLLLRDLLALPGRRRHNRDELAAAIDWLCLAQDATQTRAVSGWYDFYQGWSSGCTETTACVASTFLNASDALQRHELTRRAKEMLDWLLTRQSSCGAFANESFHKSRQPTPSAAITGRSIKALLAGFRFLGEAVYIDAALRSARWLCDLQQSDGSWPRAVNTPVQSPSETGIAAPLIDLGQETGRREYIQAAVCNLNWTLRHQQPDGWFACIRSASGQSVYLHHIGQILSDLWNSGTKLKDQRYHQAAEQASSHLLQHARHGTLAGAYAEGWVPRTPGYRNCCLVGRAQIACLWLNMYLEQQRFELFDTTVETLNALRSLQDLDNPSPPLRGGLRGSYPITGPFMPMTIISRGTTLLVDALLLERSCWLSARTHRPTTSLEADNNAYEIAAVPALA